MNTKVLIAIACVALNLSIVAADEKKTETSGSKYKKSLAAITQLFSRQQVPQNLGQNNVAEEYLKIIDGKKIGYKKRKTAMHKAADFIRINPNCITADNVNHKGNVAQIAALSIFIRSIHEFVKLPEEVDQKQRDIKTVKALIDLKADVNQKDPKGKTPLFFSKSIAVDKILLSVPGIELEAKDKKNQNALDYRMQKQDPSILRELRTVLLTV